MLFSTLCVMLYSGGEDCSYQWTQISDPILNERYYDKTGLTTEDKLLAFTHHPAKQVEFGPGVAGDIIVHEIKHVICALEYERHGVNHPDCRDHFEFVP